MKKISILFCLLLAISTSVFAKDKVFSTFFQGAIRGYDPVAYFTESKPVVGNSKYKYEYEGATWKFSSAKNLKLFKENPEKYAPQYGGHCSYAMSYGSFATSVPEAWTIKNDKLYLNYSLSVREAWKKDKPKFIKKADANWDKFWPPQEKDKKADKKL